MKKTRYVLLALAVMLISALAFGAITANAAGSVKDVYVTPDGLMKHCACGNVIVVDAEGTIEYRSPLGLDGCKNNGKTGADFVGCNGLLLKWTRWDGAAKGKLPETTGNYYLAGSFNVTAPAVVEGGQDIRLDLNGKTVTGKNTQIMVTKAEKDPMTGGVTQTSSVTVCDSTKGGSGTMKGAAVTSASGGILEVGSYMALYGGTYQNGSARNGGNVAVKGGQLDIFDGVSISDGKADSAEWGGGNLVVIEGLVNLYGGTISGGKVVDGSGAVSGAGGNIRLADGKLYMYGGRIFNSAVSKTAEIGSNLALGNHCTFEMLGGRIKGGNATNGGSIYQNGGNITVRDGVITGGKAARYGGNLYINSGNFNLVGGTVENGETVGYAGWQTADPAQQESRKPKNGGNLYIAPQGVAVIRSTIRNGVAGECGGNIAVRGELWLSDAQILGGTAAYYGDGLYIETLWGSGAKPDQTTYVKNSYVEKSIVAYTTEIAPMGALEISGNSKLLALHLDSKEHPDYVTITDLGAEADIRIVMEADSLTGLKIAKTTKTVDTKRIRLSVDLKKSPVFEEGYLVWADSYCTVEGEAAYGPLDEIFAQAAESGKTVTLTANYPQPLVLPGGKTVKLNLNGFSITGLITGSGTLSVIDSANDDYVGGGTIQAANTVKVEPVTKLGNKTYIALKEGLTYSFHRLYMKITAVGIRADYTDTDPANVLAGRQMMPMMYYVATIAGDAKLLAAIDYYGVATKIGSIPTALAEGTYVKASTEGAPAATALSIAGTHTFGMVVEKPDKYEGKDNLAGMQEKICGVPFVKLKSSAAPIYGDPVQGSLADYLEPVYELWYAKSLNNDQTTALNAMHAMFKDPINKSGLWAPDERRGR